jgi:hypothetical protein
LARVGPSLPGFPACGLVFPVISGPLKILLSYRGYLTIQNVCGDYFSLPFWVELVTKIVRFVTSPDSRLYPIEP